MKEIITGKNGAGKRLDRFLAHYLPGAPKSLLYAQLRKKNITLNGSKAAGSEILNEDDRIQCFFSDETWEKFLNPGLKGESSVAEKAGEMYRRIHGVKVLYEDEDVIALDKPAGLLTQRADPGDMSLNDWLIGYMTEKGETDEQGLAVFRPSACHRLDRNTGGIVLCAKTLKGAHLLSGLISDKRLEKHYHAAVHGRLDGTFRLKGVISKDRETNTSSFSNDGEGAEAEAVFTPLAYSEDRNLTLTDALLITGRPHQLRVQLASSGHAIAGDRKYGGNAVKNDKKELGADHQFLHCVRITFPEASDIPENLSGRTIESTAPFERLFGTVTED